MLFEDYPKQLARQAEQADTEAICRAGELLERCYRQGRRIWVFGNGGSAATANHFSADFEKNAVPSGMPRPHILSLSESCEKILAYGNDIAFERVFSQQLESAAQPGDVVLAISASGNSPNVICGVQRAKKMGVQVIGFTGFSGGELRRLADISVHYDVESYELAEDLHAMSCHMLVLFFKQFVCCSEEKRRRKNEQVQVDRCR